MYSLAHVEKKEYKIGSAVYYTIFPYRVVNCWFFRHSYFTCFITRVHFFGVFIGNDTRVRLFDSLNRLAYFQKHTHCAYMTNNNQVHKIKSAVLHCHVYCSCGIITGISRIYSLRVLWIIFLVCTILHAWSEKTNIYGLAFVLSKEMSLSFQGMSRHTRHGGDMHLPLFLSHVHTNKFAEHIQQSIKYF